MPNPFNPAVNPTLHSKSEVANLFSEEEVILVHCSSKVRLAGADRNPPLARLKNVLRSRGDVPASTIQIGDQLPQNFGHAGQYTGHLGLILEPRSFADISVSWHEDAGSSIDPSTGRRRSNEGEGHNQPAQIRTAIRHRGKSGVQTSHNEICCAGYRVVGIFTDTKEPLFGMKQPLPGDSIPQSEIDAWLDDGGVQVPWNPQTYQYRLDQVGAQFADLPLFFWVPNLGKFLRLFFDRSRGVYNTATATEIPIGQVYDCPARY